MSARDIQSELPPAQGDTGLGVEELDATFPAHLEKYRQYIQHLDISEAQQRELLEALWLLMNEFVEHSFSSPHSPVHTSHAAPGIAKSRN